MAVTRKEMSPQLGTLVNQAAQTAVEQIRKMLENPQARDADRLKAAQLLVDLACIAPADKAQDAPAQTPEKIVRFEIDGQAQEYAR